MSNSNPSSGSVLVADPGIAWRDVAGEVVLLNPKEDVIMGLNGCGGETWKLLDGARTLGEIAEAIASKYNAKLEQVLEDVVAFAAVLLQRGLAQIAA